MKANNRGIQLNKTDQAVLALTANAVFHAGRSLPKQVEWGEVYEECCYQAVPLIGINGAAGQDIPDEIFKKWKQNAIACAYRNIQVSCQHAELDKIMTAAHIPYVILKGCASARYYPQPQDRAMGDVDFLVRKEDIERAGQILEKEGFVPWEENHICHVVYRKPPVHYEMHFEPAGVPYGKAGELVKEYLKDVMDQSEEVKTVDGTIRCPSVFHHGLIILLHTSHHFLGEGIGLRHLCDWAVFVASLSDQEFRDIFEEKFRAIGIWKFAGILTKASEIGLGCPHKEWTEDISDDLAIAVLSEIFESGNFGAKSQDRVYETLFISSRGKGGVGRTSMIRQAVISLNEIIRTKWPAAKKLWFLLPIGWTFYGVRYIIRIICGKRPTVNIKQVVDEAEQRRELYREFGLFE